MRIATDSTAELLAALGRTQREQELALQQISSGRRISAASDDPAAMAAWIQNRSREVRNDEFTYSVTSIKALLQTSDSTLNSVVAGLERAVSLGVAGATGTMTEASRKAIADEVKGIRENLLTLANASFRGSYLFAGTNVQTKPFSEDSSGAVAYAGDSGVLEAAVGENRLIEINTPGDQIFAKPGADVFKALDQLIACLGTGDSQGISDATASVRSAFDHVTAERVSYGNGIAQLNSTEVFLNSEAVQLSDQENEIAGADQAEAISNLLNAQTARDAALAAAGKMSKLSLLDYLS